jgi:hypothetical protein
MRMLVTVEVADAGTKSGTHRVLIIGRGSEGQAAGDIGLSLEEAKTLISAIESEFVCAQAAEIVEARRRCSFGKRLAIKDWKLRRIHTTFGRAQLPSPRVMRCTCKQPKHQITKRRDHAAGITARALVERSWAPARATSCGC